MIHELRSYDIVPCHMAAYLDVFRTRGLPIISGYARLLAYWVAETGSVPRVHHLWEHASVDDWIEGRHALRKDTQWLKDYLPHALPMIDRQHSHLLAPVATDAEESLRYAGCGTVPRRVFTIEWLIAQASVGTAGQFDGARNYGTVWKSLTGDLRTRIRIRRLDADGTAALMHGAEGAARSAAEIHTRVEIVTPVEFSPLQ